MTIRYLSLEDVKTACIVGFGRDGWVLYGSQLFFQLWVDTRCCIISMWSIDPTTGAIYYTRETGFGTGAKNKLFLEDYGSIWRLRRTTKGPDSYPVL